MRRGRQLQLAAAISAGIATIAGTGAASIAGANSGFRSFRVEVTSTADLTQTTNGTRECLTSGVCRLTGILHETLTGTWQGIGNVGGVTTVRPARPPVVVGSSLVSANIDGCGNGTFAVVTTSDIRSDGSVRGRWQIVPGSATGALEGLTGNGATEPQPPSAPTSFVVHRNGKVRCKPSQLL